MAWVFVSKSPDVRDAWDVYCPRYGLASIGNSEEHAIEMIIEAVKICFADDLNSGLDPSDRKGDYDNSYPSARAVWIEVSFVKMEGWETDESFFVAIAAK